MNHNKKNIISALIFGGYRCVTREENYFNQLSSISKSLSEISKTMELFNERLETMEEKINV